MGKVLVQCGASEEARAPVCRQRRVRTRRRSGTLTLSRRPCAAQGARQRPKHCPWCVPNPAFHPEGFVSGCRQCTGGSKLLYSYPHKFPYPSVTLQSDVSLAAGCATGKATANAGLNAMHR